MAREHGVSREDQDAFASENQTRAARAIETGLFRDQIVPVEVQVKRDLGGFDTDEHPKPTTLEGLGKLRPAFEKDGTVTAGNASGLNDDAAALVLARHEVAEAAGLKPKFRILGCAHRGQPRAWAGRGESEPEWRRHCAWPPCRRDRRHSGGEEHV